MSMSVSMGASVEPWAGCASSPLGVAALSLVVEAMSKGAYRELSGTEVSSKPDARVQAETCSDSYTAYTCFENNVAVPLLRPHRYFSRIGILMLVSQRYLPETSRYARYGSRSQ